MSCGLRYLANIFRSYAEIFFLKSVAAGLGIAAVTFFNINIGVSGLLGVISSYVFAWFLGVKKDFQKDDAYRFNALLVGMSIGYLYTLSTFSVLLVLMGSAMVVVATIALSHSLFTLFKLPVLSLPFVLVSSVVYLAVSQYSQLFSLLQYGGYYPVILWLDNLGLLFNFELLPNLVLGYLRSLGTIMFTPHPLAGAIFALLIFIRSRFLFLYSLWGYTLGTFMYGYLTGNLEAAYFNINSFNYLLVAMVLGAVFVVPSWKSICIAAIGVMMTVLLTDAILRFWLGYNVFVFTLPFVIVSYSVLYVLKILGSDVLAHKMLSSPEKTREYHQMMQKRFKGAPIKLALPFKDEWYVWQGNDGLWTHKGAWRYAYDFVIEKNTQTYANTGERLEDYYAYNQPVLSPCSGRVVTVCSHVKDNPPATVDKENNWGNYILIALEDGCYVKICHLKQASIQVHVGAWVSEGDEIALCGNSGYSPQPHIHIHVQTHKELNAPTTYFGFHSFAQDGCMDFSGDLLVGKNIIPLEKDETIQKALNFLLSDKYILTFHDEKGTHSYTEVEVELNQEGETFLKTKRGRLYFYNDPQRHYFYRLEGKDPYLKILYKALPSLPYVKNNGICWKDSLPSYLLNSWISSLIALILGSRSVLYKAMGMDGDVKAEIVNENTGQSKVYTLSVFDNRILIHSGGQSLVLEGQND